MPRRRTFWRGVTVLLVVASLFPAPAAAGIPIIDLKTSMAYLRNLVAQVGDYYFAMREWRDQMLDKAQWANEKALAVLQQRRDLEQQAYGELAGIGRGLPDWTEFANECEYDINDVSVCNITRVAGRRIQKIVSLGTDSVQSTFFKGANAVEDEIESLIGRGSSAIVARLSSAGAHPLNSLEQYHRTQAESANNLEDLSVRLDSLVATVETEEQLDEMVSSGRADQLVAHISVQEALADLELTRQRVQQLKIQTLDVMDRMLLLNRHQQRNTTSILGF